LIRRAPPDISTWPESGHCHLWIWAVMPRGDRAVAKGSLRRVVRDLVPAGVLERPRFGTRGRAWHRGVPVVRTASVLFALAAASCTASALNTPQPHDADVGALHMYYEEVGCRWPNQIAPLDFGRRGSEAGQQCPSCSLSSIPYVQRSGPTPTLYSRTWRCDSNSPYSAAARRDLVSLSIASSGCGCRSIGHGEAKPFTSFAQRP
jgi:hypothetical protein